MFERLISPHSALATLALLAVAPAPAVAQAKVGFVSFQAPALSGHLRYFKDGMNALGHIEGQTYTLESHFTGGNRDATKDAIDALVTELRAVRDQLDTPERVASLFTRAQQWRRVLTDPKR